MDRSQVREFGMKSSIYSSRLMGLNSVLHSPRSSLQRDIHLRKSRITNIPDTKHITLSNKLDMVVVFQTIQIERLSQQIETLRVKTKQYQRQLFNYDHYEIQIKQLTQKCFRLENEKNSYRQQLYQNKQASQLIFNQLEQIKKKYISVDFTTNEKYKLEKIRNDQLMVEVEKWKQRYHSLDQSKSIELQQIKKIMSQQSKSSLSRQTKQLFDRFQGQKDDMQQLLKSLKQTNVEKQTQLKKIKYQLQNKDQLFDQMEKQVDQYQEKVALLSQENYRLSELVKNKQSEINKLKQNVKKSEEITIRINQQILTKTQENKKITNKLQKLQQLTNEKDLRLNKLQKSQLNDKERLSELDRIVFLLRQRENELESKNKLIERKEKRIVMMEGEMKSLQEVEVSTKKEIETLKQENHQQSLMIEKMLQRIQNLFTTQQFIKTSINKSSAITQTYIKNFTQQVNQKTTKLTQYSNKLINELHQSQTYIFNLQQLNKGSSEKILFLEHQKLQTLQKIQQFRQLQESHRVLIKQYEKLQLHIDRLIKQRDQLIEENQNKHQQIMNQTQIQLKVMEQNYQNNVIKKLQTSLSNQQQDYHQLKNNCILMEKKVQQFQLKAKMLQEEAKMMLENKELQWENKFKIVAAQLNTKTQTLMKEKNCNKELKTVLENFVKFYQSNVEVQIQQTVKRIEPLQKMIKQLKQLIFENLVRQQHKFIEKQRMNEEKIQELSDFCMILAERNQKLFESLITGKDLYTKTFTVNNAKNIYYEEQTYKPSSIYTSTTNQNFNSSNILGVGSKIKQELKTNLNNQTSTSIPIEFLIKHVLLCAELESLRQRIGDKNAKVQKMKHSLMVSNVSSNKSFVAIVNGAGKSQNNNINEHQNEPHGQMMLQSGMMSTTIINKLGNPFMNSVVRSINNENSVIHQSRLIEMTERTSRIGQQLNIRRVISQDRFGAKSPDSSSVLEESQIKNQGIYTKRLGGGSGLGKNGFKSIGIKKSIIYN